MADKTGLERWLMGKNKNELIDLCLRLRDEVVIYRKAIDNPNEVMKNAKQNN